MDKPMCTFNIFFIIIRLFLKRLQGYKRIWNFFVTSITLLNTHCLFNGPLEYKQYDAQKVEPHAQLSEHPIVLFQGSDEQLIGVK